MIKIGLELEEFCVSNETNEIVLVPERSNIPLDGCGWLIEYRSQPCNDITEAVHSLFADKYRNKKKLEAFGVRGLLEPIAIPSKKVREGARRRFRKEVQGFNNIYKYTSHRNTAREATAAVHISVTYNRDFIGQRPINGMFDYAHFIKYMDSQFKDEIKSTKRNPGFYQVKDFGRFEYRSLPNNISLSKLIDVVNDYNFII